LICFMSIADALLAEKDIYMGSDSL
jgi:hypothetical protein